MNDPSAELPADPDVKIPAAVRRSSARATEIHMQAYKPEPVTSEGNPPADKPPETPPPEAPETPPADKPERTTDDWKRDYNSMKGRYEAEKRDRHTLATRVGELEAVIASMQVTQQPEKSAVNLIRPEEVETYGEEFLDVVGRKTRETVGGEVENLKKQVANLTKQLGQVSTVQVVDAKEKMLSKLDRKVPNWRQINHDQGFIDWLALTDTYSGDIRHELLKQAFARCETDRVLAFFKGYLKEAAQAPASEGNTAPAADPPAPVSLEALAAPGRAKTSAAAPAPGEKPIITGAQIQQFYRDVQHGKYRGRDEEKKANEAMIFEAMREGRIR